MPFNPNQATWFHPTDPTTVVSTLMKFGSRLDLVIDFHGGGQVRKHCLIHLHPELLLFHRHDFIRIHDTGLTPDVPKGRTIFEARLQSNQENELTLVAERLVYAKTPYAFFSDSAFPVRGPQIPTERVLVSSADVGFDHTVFELTCRECGLSIQEMEKLLKQMVRQVGGRPRDISIEVMKAVIRQAFSDCGSLVYFFQKYLTIFDEVGACA